MLEKAGALLGIAVVCAVALGGLWLVAERVFDRLEDAADPGPERIRDEIEWLSYTPERTEVDVDDLHDQVLSAEAELRGIVEFLGDVEYSPIRRPDYRYGVLLGAEGSVQIAGPIQHAALRELGFKITRTHANVVQTTYPTVIPGPTVPVVEAWRSDVSVNSGIVDETWWLTFSVRPSG